MTLQEQYDDAMFDFSRSEFDSAIAKLKAVLAVDPSYFDAQLALGMAYYRKGDFATAIAEGHKAEKLRPKEQLKSNRGARMQENQTQKWKANLNCKSPNQRRCQ
jgi:cytochrome c-type biogenesis protein CcmH/NrfG